jgi:hypothetical protein
MLRGCAATLACVVWAGWASAAGRPVALFLDDPSPASRREVTAGITALGGRVLHAFDDALIVSLPAENEVRAFRLPGIREIALNGAAGAPSRQAKGPAFGRAAWNAIARGVAADRGDEVPPPLEDDGLESPHVPLATVLAASRAAAPLRGGSRLGGQDTAAALSAPFGATALTTSEFLAGSVSVNIVLVESDGTIDPQTENWSSARENEVVAAIASGLEWVRQEEPQAMLRFVYHVLPGRTDPRARTGYEPIRHAADPTGLTGEDHWAKEILGKLGYTSGDRFARSRAWAADTRSADGTDWAVNVFVVDSLADTDGAFADGRFAYCFIGGPHLVMTYDNQAWGIGRMDMVLRHELLHAFYAFDEYASSACDCAAHRGYLDGLNTNCAACNPVAQACVMISNGDAMCDATRRHVGWADLDGDGVIDVVGQDPETFLDALPAEVCGAPALSGTASVVPATNRNTYGGTSHPSISINRITGLEVRIDGSPWVLADGGGGAWGVAQPQFREALPPLPEGRHHIEARAVDDAGNRDGTPEGIDVVVHAGAAALGDTLSAARSESGVAISWAPAAGAASYRVYRRADPRDAPALVAQPADASWIDPYATSGYYDVRAVDACGNEGAD